MNILHICLTGSYNDNWGYQDNIIPKYHVKAGHSVSVITTTYINSKTKLGYDIVSSGEYILDNGIKVVRLKGKSRFFPIVNQKLRIYKGLYQAISISRPDFIFIHGVQFWDIKHVARYMKENMSVRLVVDNHADFSNSARTWVSKNLIHSIIWKRCASIIYTYVDKFFGVLPARVEFLNQLYNIPLDRIELLVMGADDEFVEIANNSKHILDVRSKHCIAESDFLIVTGGKIDLAKKDTLELMRVIHDLGKPNIKLIVFGSVIESLENEFKTLVDGKNIIYVGWLNEIECYTYISASNLAFFPGRHSVIWEQVVALGVPLVVKKWVGTTHVDIGGNVVFLEDCTNDTIKHTIVDIVDNNDKYSTLKQSATNPKKDMFLYSEIAAKSIKHAFEESSLK